MSLIVRFRALGSLAVLPIEYLFDSLLALRYSKASLFAPKEKVKFYDIILLAHTVEKGLSQPSPRAGFGKPKIRQLLKLLYSTSWSGSIQFAAEKAYGALLEYARWNNRNGYDIQDIHPLLNSFFQRCEAEGVRPNGGTKVLDLQSAAHPNTARDLLSRRFSGRIYSPKLVDDDLLSSVLSLAQRAPSQCNRQSVRVHCFRGRESVLPLLKLQRGAAGFDEYTPNLFVITSEMVAWSGANARNQAFVDGGLFSMQLSLACSSLGLISCPLNLAIGNLREFHIKRFAGIPQHERLIMMMSFGYPASDEADLVAARSARLPLNQVLTVH
jgi:nitroreductase